MLEVESLVKTFPTGRGKSRAGVKAVDNVSLHVNEGEFYTLLGPSGCGKTTTLRSVAGLETPDSGAIKVADETLYSSSDGVNVPTHLRALGMVFQSYAIWPHMNVYKNVAFPLTVRKARGHIPKQEVKKRVERALSVVQLDHLADRQATDLSGGQQQRLALARALVLEPPLLLLDEPLSNLDAKLREEMRFELKRLQRDLGITTIYVTHDQVEALSMSNVIAVLQGGRVEQVGKPRAIYEEPASRFVADFIGASNLVDARVVRVTEGDLYLFSTPQGDLHVSSPLKLNVGDEVTVSVRPEYVSLSAGKETVVDKAGVWSGRIEARGFTGETMEYRVLCGTRELRVRTDATLSLPPGTEVTMTIHAERCSVIPRGE